MSPSDGMENTDKKREAHKTPAKKMTTNKKSVDKTSAATTSVAKTSFGEMLCGEMSFSFDNMSLTLEEASPALDTKAVDKMSVENMVVAKVSPALDKTPVDKVSTGAKHRRIEPVTEKSKPKTGFRFMDLPDNIRSQIRHEALLMDDDRGKPFLTSGLASVSKEWRDDIDETLFNDITINPLDHQEVSAFKEMFSTDRRRQLLTRLYIAIDDSKAGPWHSKKGIFQIGRITASIGHLLGYVNGWDLRKDGGGRRHMEIIFSTSRFPDARIDWSHSKRPIVNTTSLWETSQLKKATGSCFKLASKLFSADNLKFPSSLDMVTHLSIPPDCLPFCAADRIIQAMPNLETLILDPKFDVRSYDGWRHLTDIILLLSGSAPSLQCLEVRNTAFVSTHGLKPTPAFYLDFMGDFSNALRDYSQGLRSLRATPFKLDDDFIRPFSPHTDHNYSATWVWPQLQHLDLQFCEGVPYERHVDQAMDPEPYKEWEGCELQQEWGPDGEEILYIEDSRGNQLDISFSQDEEEYELREPAFTAFDVIVAAGRATWSMPVLESARISVCSHEDGDSIIFVKRKLCPRSGTPTSSRVWLSGDFDYDERADIWDAWLSFLGRYAEFDEGLQSEFPEVTWASRSTR